MGQESGYIFVGWTTPSFRKSPQFKRALYHYFTKLLKMVKKDRPPFFTSYTVNNNIVGVPNNPMGVGTIFFQGGVQWMFSGGGQKDCFQGVATVIKFHSINSKLREKHFSTTELLGKYRLWLPLPIGLSQRRCLWQQKDLRYFVITLKTQRW